MRTGQAPSPQRHFEQAAPRPPGPPAHAHVRRSAERAALGPRWAMASILDEYEDSLHRSVSVQQSRASVGIPHSGTCAPGPPWAVFLLRAGGEAAAAGGEQGMPS